MLVRTTPISNFGVHADAVLFTPRAARCNPVHAQAYKVLYDIMLYG